MQNNSAWPDEEDTETKKRREEARARVRAMFPGLRPPASVTDAGRSNDNFITRAEAAKMLDVHERTVYRLLKQGRLRTLVRGTKHGVVRGDVDAMLSPSPDEDELPVPINRRTLTRMRRELVLLRDHLERCKKVLGMRWTPLGLSPEDLVVRYNDAALAAAKGCDPKLLRFWTDVLARIRLDDLSAIERATGEPHPWIPFCALAGELEPNVDTLHLAAAFELVSAAKQNVDGLAYIWIVKKHGEEQLQRLLKKISVESSTRGL